MVRFSGPGEPFRTGVEVEMKRFCPSCGRPIESKARFCSSCEARAGSLASDLRDTAVQRQAAVPPPDGSAAFLPEQRVIATAPAEPERWLNFAVIAFGIVVAVFEIGRAHV